MSHQFHLTDFQDAEVAEYRSFSGWAVVALLIGILSPLALADPLVWAVPIAGIAISSWALRRIKQNAPALLGRKTALAGLWLAAFFLAVASSDWCYHRWLIRSEARQVALFWFELLAKNRPESALQLTLSPESRQPLDARIWDFYKNTKKWRKALRNYVAEGKPQEPPRLVRTLLALGDSAQVRYLSTLSQIYIESQEWLTQLYALTFEEAGEKKTFFISIQLARVRLSNGRSSWRIIGAQGGVGPDGNKPS